MRWWLKLVKALSSASRLSILERRAASASSAGREGFTKLTRTNPDMLEGP